MPIKTLANLAVTGQALHLVGSTFPSKKKKKKKKGVVRTGVDVIVGTSLLRVSAANAAAL